LEGDIAAKLLSRVLAHPRVKRLLSTDHFSVDGTLIEAWASMKSFKPKDGSDEPPAGSHCFDRIHNQVQHDLLQLNTIPLNGKRPLRKAGIHRDSILGDFTSRQYNHFIDRLIEIKTILLRRRFPNMVADAIDDGPGSIGIVHDTAERFPDLAQVRRLLVQEIQGCTRVVARSSDRLLDFVSDRSSKLTQSRYTTHMRGGFGIVVEFRFALAQSFLGAFALRQINHERNTFVATLFKARQAD
jgi:hypothetical protein